MKKGEKRKQELLECAYRLFIQKGYDQTSVDEIIAEAHIAKGTYYHYFQSKEAMLEEVINMMIAEEADRAKSVISAPIPVEQKLVSVIVTLRPNPDELTIVGTLERPENIVMHTKTKRKIIDVAVPLLTEAVKEGTAQGVFNCTNIENRVKMILIMSQELFDNGAYTVNDIDVFIDMTEKTLGAKPGTLGFIKELIN
ncbi:MAG: TetR/AcrR family transcriptional regulator [Ruminococcus sp.]|nr:TetR/AcrR family transcriptional regulator [Ruminococcus sp.]